MKTPVNPGAEDPGRQIAASWAQLEERSVLLLGDTQNQHGSWPASPTFTQYGFSWFRDGSFIADGASACGLASEADRFHDWCGRVLEGEASAIEAAICAADAGVTLRDEDYLPARYQLDGTRQDDDWWNFQVDGYGTWLWALRRHLARHSGSAEQWQSPVVLAARYLIATGLAPCRDWWEENRDQRHVATLAGVCAGLESAVALGVLPADVRTRAIDVATSARNLITSHGVHDARLGKWLGGTGLDASTLSVAGLYDVLALDDPRVETTVEAVERQLTSACDAPTGVHRYLDDTFYGGGQWPVLTCLLATHHLRTGKRERAAQLLDWVVSTTRDDLLLPEQVAPQLAPGRIAEWNARWGPSAHPLLWSHGAFLSALEVWRAT